MDANVKGSHFKAILEEMGLDYRDIHDMNLLMDAPGTISVTQFLRNEKGQFYRDGADIAAKTVVAQVDWTL